MNLEKDSVKEVTWIIIFCKGGHLWLNFRPVWFSLRAGVLTFHHQCSEIHSVYGTLFEIKTFFYIFLIITCFSFNI